jgi:hypothetical protein
LETFRVTGDGHQDISISGFGFSGSSNQATAIGGEP